MGPWYTIPVVVGLYATSRLIGESALKPVGSGRVNSSVVVPFAVVTEASLTLNAVEGTTPEGSCA